MTSPVLTPVSITHLKFLTFSNNRQDAGMLGAKLSPGHRIFPALQACSYKMQIEQKGKKETKQFLLLQISLEFQSVYLRFLIVLLTKS